MNREIKFRAFDDGKMIYQTQTILTNEFDQLSWFFKSIRKDAILMQFTGLKDNKRTKEFPNGQDIYINDLHRDVDGDVFKVIQLECGRYALKMILNNYVDEFVDWNCIKIIGNIHEQKLNPELS